MTDQSVKLIFMLILGIACLLATIAFLVFTQAGLETSHQVTDTLLLPGLLRIDSIELTYKDIDSNHRSYFLTIKNVQHEHGKQLTVLPIIKAGKITDENGERELLSRPDSDKLGGPTDYPSYNIGGNINGYFARIPIAAEDINKPIHVSIWEYACLKEIGFTERPSQFTFEKVVRRCSGSYLISFEVKATNEQDCSNLKTKENCNSRSGCYYSTTDNQCNNCKAISTKCEEITEVFACKYCRYYCDWISENSDPLSNQGKCISLGTVRDNYRNN